MVLGDLAEFTHFVTRIKIVPALADDVSLMEAERVRGRAFATKLSMRVLARTWQMLLKGIGEVEAAGRPVDAAEMVLVRIAYAADLPTPDEVIRSLNDTRGNGAAAQSSASAAPAAPSRPELRSESRAPTLASPARGGAMGGSAAVAQTAPREEPVARDSDSTTPARTIKNFAELIALATEKRDIGSKSALERDVRLVRFEDGTLEVALEPSARPTLVGELSKKLTDWTGRRWMVAVSAEAGMPSMRAQSDARKAELKDTVRADPLVQAVLQRFPGAEIVDVRPPGGSVADDVSEMPEALANESDFDA
jgi:DNA polymerase-3 subunit gamma/tau